MEHLVLKYKKVEEEKTNGVLLYLSKERVDLLW